jgi:hypothetical protein
MQIAPRYYLPGEVRAMRDADRRRYRANVALLVIYQVLVIGPIRLAFDTALNNPRFGNLAFVKPYIVPGMVVLVLLIWVIGIKMAFRRKGY